MRPVANKITFAMVGALLVPCFGRLALHGTGHEDQYFRYFVPFFVGGLAGFLIGLMKDRWLKLQSTLESLVEDRTKGLKDEIKERKQAEDALLEAHDEMEHRVKERTAELVKANEQLKQEIEERRLVEDSLRDSEAKYSALVENSKDGIIMIQDGILIFINRASVALVGFSLEEMIGANFMGFAAPDCRELVLQRYTDRIEGKEVPAIYEIELLRKDGTTVPVELNANRIVFKGKSADLAFIRDISERKQAEVALKVSEEKYRDLVENINNVIYATDEKGRLTYISPVIESRTGFKTSELIGKTFFDFVHPDDLPHLMKQLQERLAGIIKPSEYRLITKSGEIRWVRSSSRPIYEGDRIIGLRGVLTDITEEKRLEVQLRQAQKMEALGTLGGGVAHDFNNLLMGIQGRTSMMLMDVDSSHPHFEQLQEIEDYVKSAADLTKQLLGFARGGKYEVKPTDINELIKKSSQMFGRTKKEIKIHRKYQKDVWTMEADQGQIEQVLMNLYVNAWQAMPGGGNIYIQTENVTLDKNYVKSFKVEPGKYVKISVTDTGVGMDKATQQRIFDPFFTTKETGRGTGLGLASAYGIIKNHDGFINVYSEKGEGTTFKIYFPASGSKVSGQTSEISEEVRHGNETVLLVDDENMIITVGQRMLEKMGYTVLTAGNGKEAIDVYKKKKDKIDIVILDMIMPDMNGGHTFDRMKEIKTSVKVLLSSGYSIDGKATEILKRGCNSFIQKPFDMKQLSRKIKEILDKDA